MRNYVAAFVFADDDRSEVLLVRKKKPDFMAGKFNGIGGEIEPDETPVDAMAREASEELNRDLQCGVDWWTEFARIRRPSACIHCFSVTSWDLVNGANGTENDIGEMMTAEFWTQPDVVGRMFGDVHFLLQLACLEPTQPVDIYLGEAWE